MLHLSPIITKLPVDRVERQEVLANGVPTGLIVGKPMAVATLGFDKSGKPIGNVSGTFSGAYTAFISLLVLPTNEGYRLVQPLKELPCGELQKADGKGRYLGIAYDYFPRLDEPFERVPHGFLLTGLAIQNLGPADELWFGKQGEILGKFVGDVKGRAMSVHLIGESYEYGLAGTRASERSSAKIS